jgi:hypothetical protein
MPDWLRTFGHPVPVSTSFPDGYGISSSQRSLIVSILSVGTFFGPFNHPTILRLPLTFFIWAPYLLPPSPISSAANEVSSLHASSSPSESLYKQRQQPFLSSSSVVSSPASAWVWSPLWFQCISPSALPSGSVVPSSVSTNGLSPSASSSLVFSTTLPRTDRITLRIGFPLSSSSSGQQFLLLEWPSFPRYALSCLIALTWLASHEPDTCYSSPLVGYQESS